ncbi:MAG: LapA family protein [Proteobacteria bacterium]|nr:MAG: LapA family protein [Pseudomonadota bacterium]
MRNVLLTVSVVLAAVFMLQNFHSIELSFVVWHFQTTVAMALLWAVVLGGVIGVLAMLPWTLRTRREARHIRQQLDAAAALPKPPAAPDPRAAHPPARPR